MNHETFFENLELLADAPNVVQKLREMILQLAVQGKLVPHNQNDKQALIQLENLKIEKKRLIKENKIRKSKTSPIKPEEIPFQIPDNWEWVKIGEAMNLINGRAFKPVEWTSSGLPIIRIQNLNNPEAPFNFCDFEVDEKFHVRNSDFLISWSGTPGTSFGAFIWNRGHAILNQHIFRADLFGEEYNNDYLKFAINSRLDEMIAQAHGAVGLKHITKGKLENLILPLPPFEEQKRIVAKVDQLMALCDQLEARQHEKHEKRILLNNAALDKLLTAPTPGEFAQHWQRICDNFDLLYDAPETVGQLRQAILQLAVQGKLVAQDEGDEPASVLLEEINNEKEQLIKDKKISKVKLFPPIKENEISYKLPDKWMWVRLGDALLKITDGTHHSPPNGPKGEFKYITAKNIKSKGINLSNITYVSAKVHEEIYNRCDPEPGNILYIKDGATTGIVTINDLNEQFSMLSSVALLKNPSKIYNRYLLYVLKSPYFYSLMRDDMSGVAITRVTLTKLNRALIPLAPFEEQKRIVAKVDQLMALCDELEAGLVQAQTDGGKLMEAVVHYVLAE